MEVGKRRREDWGTEKRPGNKLRRDLVGKKANGKIQRKRPVERMERTGARRAYSDYRSR